MMNFSPEQLAQHYTAFRVGERVLLTGHSHQAWPDCARDALLESFHDAAECVDKKWERAMVKAARVERGFAELLGDTTGEIQLFANTHDAIVRLLSALPYRQRAQIITTSGEFHSVRRQLQRLQEDGVEIVTVPSEPLATLTERMAAQVSDRTLAVFCSAVQYVTSAIVPKLHLLAEAGQRWDAAVVIDVYHALNVVPFDIAALGLSNCFVVGGGYKYCQLGEGNCFLRYPTDREFRPVLTGWFAEHSQLALPPTDGPVMYDPHHAFAGATYDPASHYRAARVFDFFAEQQLTPARLRAINQTQKQYLLDGLQQLQLPTTELTVPQLPIDATGGFLSVPVRHAKAMSDALQLRGVWTDQRNGMLRLGPAPYVTNAQLDLALAAIAAVV